MCPSIKSSSYLRYLYFFCLNNNHRARDQMVLLMAQRSPIFFCSPFSCPLFDLLSTSSSPVIYQQQAQIPTDDFLSLRAICLNHLNLISSNFWAMSLTSAISPCTFPRLSMTLFVTSCLHKPPDASKWASVWSFITSHPLTGLHIALRTLVCLSCLPPSLPCLRWHHSQFHYLYHLNFTYTSALRSTFSHLKTWEGR